MAAASCRSCCVPSPARSTRTARRGVHQGHRHRPGATGGQREPRPADRPDRGRCVRRRGALDGRSAAVPGGGQPPGNRRGVPAALALPRPASTRARARDPDALAGHPGDPPGDGHPRLPRHRDAVPHPQHPGRRAGLPRAGATAAGALVRPAAVAAAVQAAADGRRDGALLPDRALLPGRGLPRRPAAGVHPARHRDELPR